MGNTQWLAADCWKPRLASKPYSTAQLLLLFPMGTAMQRSRVPMTTWSWCHDEVQTLSVSVLHTD